VKKNDVFLIGLPASCRLSIRGAARELWSYGLR
jgi:hypothetical protein